MNNIPMFMPEFSYPNVNSMQNQEIMNLENKVNNLEKEIVNLKNKINNIEKKTNNNYYQTSSYNMM